MITSEMYVIVIAEHEGDIEYRKIPIASSKGELMTNRLKKLLAGHMSHPYGEYRGGISEIRMIGLFWRRPYTILREIAEDRIKRQKQLMAEANALNHHGPDIYELISEPPLEVPDQAGNEEISELMRREIDFRHRVKVKIKEIQNIGRIGPVAQK